MDIDFNKNWILNEKNYDSIRLRYLAEFGNAGTIHEINTLFGRFINNIRLSNNPNESTAKYYKRVTVQLLVTLGLLDEFFNLVIYK